MKRLTDNEIIRLNDITLKLMDIGKGLKEQGDHETASEIYDAAALLLQLRNDMKG